MSDPYGLAITLSEMLNKQPSEKDVFADVPDLIAELQDRHEVSWDLLALKASEKMQIMSEYIEMRDAQMRRTVDAILTLVKLLQRV